ncbi:MAG TPA: hypothetical protein VF188_15875, partial [Longimicrobiales bacterium]
IEFPLRGDTTVSDLEEFYGIRMEAAADTTLDELLRERLGDDLVPGAAVTLEGVMLYAREMLAGRVERVGLVIQASDDVAPDRTGARPADGPGNRPDPQ